MTTSATPEHILKTYYGHSAFRPGQKALVEHILAGEDTVGIMPTGAGKSVCYQVPALLLEGVTLVISPLISLMKDQVDSLAQAGVAAAYLNSSLSAAQQRTVLERMCAGAYKIVYVAPERLDTPDFSDAVSRVSVSMVTVDEAHCISQWGQDFRPSYLRITAFLHSLPHRPIVSAFTATATAEVRDDIVRILQLHNPFVLTTGFDRPNLTFAVQKPASKSVALLDIVRRHADDSGIVYCATRKTVEQVCAALQAKGIAATQYHAGMPDDQRRTAQEDFLYDRCPVMVATNAFGMGIDKSNVAYVVHYNMPKSIENYYQEAGRAGRDGSEAECILLYSPQDVRTNQFFIEHSRSAEDTLSSEEALAVQQQDRERLRQMTFYSTTTGCLRSFLLRYFGESAPMCCNKCSNCLTQFETLDATVDAQKIVSCVYRMAQRGQRYGKAMITDVLRGTANERLQRLGLHTLTTYGLMRDVPATRIRTLLDALVQEGYLAVSDGEYPVVQLTAQSAAIVRGEAPFVVKLPKAQPKTAAASTRRENAAQTADSHLLRALKALRLTLANQANVPAYVVFTDATLTDMCRLRPTTLHEFLEVKGVGTAKAKRYGEAFIACIQENISQ